MSRIVEITGAKTMRITVPDDARLTYGPWSPPKKTARGYEDDGRGVRRGTLRIYRGLGTSNILAMFTDVETFRFVDEVQYTEQVMAEGSAKIWRGEDGQFYTEGNINIGQKPVQAVPSLPKTAERQRRTNGVNPDA